MLVTVSVEDLAGAIVKAYLSASVTAPSTMTAQQIRDACSQVDPNMPVMSLPSRIDKTWSGKVIKDVRIEQMPLVNADVKNLTFENVWVEHGGVAGIQAYSAILADGSRQWPEIYVDHATIVGVPTESSTSSSLGVGLSHYTHAQYVNVSGWEDGFRIGDTQVLEYSWAHDLWDGYTPSGVQVDNPHCDGIQTLGGEGFTVDSCVFDAYKKTWDGRRIPSNACVMIGDVTSPLEGPNVIKNSHMEGGGYQYNCNANSEATYGQYSLAFVNNKHYIGPQMIDSAGNPVTVTVNGVTYPVVISPSYGPEGNIGGGVPQVTIRDTWGTAPGTYYLSDKTHKIVISTQDQAISVN